MRIKQLAYAIGMIGFVGSVGFAQAAEEVQKTQKIEVTGSSIKRVSAEGPAPVEVITRKEIERTGATSTNELLKSLSSIDIFDQGELASNSPSGSGTSNIQIRGLSETDVLVLLNGRRLPVNPLHDGSGAGAAVDINMIPISAIERVEILKDGGSAIYGADAVAGVINFITKKNYQAVDLRARYGTSSRSDGEEKSAGVTAGFGDFDTQGFNVLAAFDIFKRDPIYRKDRDISKSVDFRGQGGSDGRSSFSPYGNILNAAGTGFTGETVRPCPPEQLGGGRCRYDFNASLLTAYNGADRMGGLLMGSVKVTDDIKAYAQFFASQTEDHYEAHPVPDYFVLPDGRYYAGRFMQGGPRITDRKSTLNQFSVGIDGYTAGLDWSLAVGQGKAKVTNRDQNYYDADKWNAALSSGAIDATVTTNDAAFVESLKVKPVRAGESKNTFVDGKVSGEGFELPGGAMGWAVGTSFVKEDLTDTPDALTQAGKVVGSIQQAKVAADRKAMGYFAELQLPVLNNLEVQAAVRYDDYSSSSNGFANSDASKASPKLAFSYKPNKSLMIRGSYSESFRMPTLKQLYGASEQGAIDIEGKEECEGLGLAANCELPAYQVGGSNVKLKPEEGESYNIGLVADVGRFSGSIDFWQVRKDNAIDQPTILDAIKSGSWGREAGSGRYLIYTNLQNISKVQTAGVDLDLQYGFKTPFGKLTVANTATYYTKTRELKSGVWDSTLGTYASPRYRNTFKAEMDSGVWQTSGAVRTTGSFADSDVTPLPENVRTVPSHTEVDMVVSYTGVKGLRVDFGVKNLFDRMPPFSNQNASDNTYTQMGFAELYSARGRFYQLGLQYNFN